MTEPYRDDLEAAQLRADELARECTTLRARNAELEALMPTDARENKHRLELALLREQAERACHEVADLQREAVLLRANPEQRAIELERAVRRQAFTDAG